MESILSSQKKQINSIGKDEIRKGGDIAITLYNEGIEAIEMYEKNMRFEKPKEVEKFTLEMLQDIQSNVEGRETMGEVTKEETVYEETDRDDR